MGQRYIRHGILNLDEVVNAILNAWDNSDHNEFERHGYSLNITSLRLKNFARAKRDNQKICCVNCGLEASFFSVDSFTGTNVRPGAHLNLYGINSNGDEVLFTHDHILARGLGGSDNLKNTQVMCLNCNAKKSRVESKIVNEIKLKHSPYLEKSALAKVIAEEDKDALMEKVNKSIVKNRKKNDEII